MNEQQDTQADVRASIRKQIAILAQSLCNLRYDGALNETQKQSYKRAIKALETLELLSE